MKKIEVLLVLLILLSIGVVYSQGGVFVGLSIGEFDSDGDGIIDSEDDDDDNDGILDTNDALTGNSSFVQSGTITANVTVNNTVDLTRSFSGTFEVVIRDINVTLVNFSFDFTEKTLNLANVTIEKKTIEGKGSLLVRGITLTTGQTKTMYVDNKNTSTDNLCIKDAQIDKISEISGDCTGASETIVTCDGTTTSGYTCTKVEDNTRYKITGLSFTGIIETSKSPKKEDDTTTTTTTTGGGGGAAGGGGGGGRIPIIATREFTLSTETLKVILKQGQTKEESFTIKNTGDLVLAIKADFKKVIDFVVSPSLDILDITLQPGEEETISIIFKADEDLQPNIYPREIYIREASEEKIISTIIEVESAKPLFDVDVEVLPEYKSIFPGEVVFLEVSLFNVRGFGRVDVNLEYSILDFQGNLIATEQETVAVETQAKFGRELLIPSDIRPGTYIASAKVTFEDSVGISSDVFEVKAKTIRLYPIALKDYTTLLLLGIIVIIIISAVSIYKFYPQKKHIPKTIEEEGKLIQKEEKVKKLEKELKALQQAFNAKFISEETYTGDRARIEKALKKLGKS